jgi:hypothetical protein
MPGFESLKFSMADIVRPTSEVPKVQDGSSTYIVVDTMIKDGAVSLPVLYANSSGEFIGFGKDSGDKLVTSNNANLVYNHTSGDRMFVASWNSSSESESYLLRFTNIQVDNSLNETEVEKYANGGWTNVAKDKKAGDTVTIGSLTLTINSVSAATGGIDKSVNVTFGAGGSFKHLYTKEGLKMFLPVNVSSGAITGPGQYNDTINSGTTGHSPDSFNLVFVEENKDDDVAQGNYFNVTLNDNSDGEVEASGITTGRTTITDPDDSNIIMSYVYSDLATMVKREGSSSDQRTVTIDYAGGESFAEVFLSVVGATVTGGGTGSGSGGTTTLGSVAIKDTEAASAANKNLVVVGGSCVNTVAAELLGSPGVPLCGSAFTTATGVASGEYLIQTFSRTGGTVATLVAGYNAQDTTNGVKYLTTQAVDTMAGKKYKGTTQTSATLVTT